jgi:predicted nucleic acid-binding protein
VIAVDTNLLVYAHRGDSAWHAAAYARVAELAEGRVRWAIPWPCLDEFLAIVTHPRITRRGGPGRQAREAAEVAIRCPELGDALQPAERSHPRVVDLRTRDPDRAPEFRPVALGLRQERQARRLVEGRLERGGRRAPGSRRVARGARKGGRRARSLWVKIGHRRTG